MMHVVKVEQFEGPLDLLLRLCEEEKFDLSRVSLAQVCDDYLSAIRESQLDPHALADFLVVASKLLLLKAEGLLPDLADEKEREEAYVLEDQLRLLARYVAAGKNFERLWRAGPFSFTPARSPVLTAFFAPPPRLQSRQLTAAFRNLVGVITPLVTLGQAVIRRTLSLEQKFAEFTTRLARALETRFSELVGRTKNREELIVSFLALLELVKQRFVSVSQEGHFGEIIITRSHEQSTSTT